MEETLNNALASAKSAFGWLETELFSAGETAVTYGSIVKFLLIVIVTYIVSRLIQNALGRFADYRGTMTQSSVYALKRITHYLIMVIGFLIAVASIGIDLTKFAIFASALGIGVGFGLQNLISNFTAGIMLLFDKTLKVGDFVELESGVTGEVQAINIRSTVITTNDNIDIVVPNSEFVNGRVTNWTMRDTYRRIHVKFGVAYGSDKEKVRKAVLEAADRVPYTLSGTSHRPPQVWLNEFGDSALNFELVVWLKPEAVNRPGAVHAAFMWEIHSSLMEYEIEIPFPQRDIHVRSWIKDEEMEAAVSKQKEASGKQKKHPDNDAADDI
ncbi:mechanosensitive ion channel family protein [Pseudidiomarina sp.]|uniref:mechanosensitive ion channel family protein n=1 Tax=Pseudidiomarina sp. TaxID=2081707 RepID=UPI00299EE1A7|nr:mechanosensitive ion channel domain-containing protein [Pseudidiomarina sp.]MDX1705811.1 mechanosensitive ion channel [Pseudidiomarina sp.]